MSICQGVNSMLHFHLPCSWGKSRVHQRSQFTDQNSGIMFVATDHAFRFATALK